MKVRYSFIAKGIAPTGIKYRTSGEVIFEEGYPMEAFEAAADCVQKAMGCRPIVGDGKSVTLRKLKTPV